MKDYRNLILMDSNKFILTATFANCSSDVAYKRYNKAYPTKSNMNNIDALKILNKHLAQIVKWKEEEKALSVYYILVPPKLCKIIKDKLYKQWIETNKASIKPEELEQWKLFSALYKLVFSEVAFKPNNIYNSRSKQQNNYKHVIFVKNTVDKMFLYLEKIEESNKAKVIEDLLKNI